MASPRTPPDQGLQADLRCPKCSYLLRGLRGQFVVCPECGQQNDVVQLLSIRRSQWAMQEHYLCLARPAIFLQKATLVLLFLVPATIASFGARYLLIECVIGCIIWGFFIRTSIRHSKMDRKIRLLCALHVALMGMPIAFIAGIGGVTAMILSFFIMLDDGIKYWNLILLVIAIILLTVAILGGMWCYRLDRAIGRYCVKWSLGTDDEEIQVQEKYMQ